MIKFGQLRCTKPKLISHLGFVPEDTAGIRNTKAILACRRVNWLVNTSMSAGLYGKTSE